MAVDVYVKRYLPSDPRLGRHVRHDPRSLRYLVKEQDPSTLKSVRWSRVIPTLDQGNLGSCTGNAAVGCVGTDPFYAESIVQQWLSASNAALDEQHAVEIYSKATQLDDYPGAYPPTDTGSDGLSVAKVLQQAGYISGYQHATSLNAVLTALASQPVIVGVEWSADMFNPDDDGLMHCTGAVQGGHEFVLDELDVENQRIWMRNSWGDNWGVQGRAYFTWDDFDALLKKDGDCTVFVAISQPAPQPTPPEPEPTPTPVPPNPEPTPIPTPDPDAELKEIVAELKDAIVKLYQYIKGD